MNLGQSLLTNGIKQSQSLRVGRQPKIDEYDMSEIRRMYAQGHTKADIAKHYHVGHQTIKRVLEAKE